MKKLLLVVSFVSFACQAITKEEWCKKVKEKTSAQQREILGYAAAQWWLLRSFEEHRESFKKLFQNLVNGQEPSLGMTEEEKKVIEKFGEFSNAPFSYFPTDQGTKQLVIYLEELSGGLKKSQDEKEFDKAALDLLENPERIALLKRNTEECIACFTKEQCVQK